MKQHLTILFLLPVFSLFANPASIDDEIRRNYIATYQDIAVREMHRSGIPASITLAQGILESQWGQGRLASGSKNHFGIKCKTEWTGARFLHQDDDYENGRLIESCFRAYDFPEDSYIDHTNFLVDNPRYAELFTYGTTDYASWARGLRKCGYATDQAYAGKLIRIIEENELAKYDFYVPEAVQPQPAVAAADTVLDPPTLFLGADFEPAPAMVEEEETKTEFRVVTLPAALAKQAVTGPRPVRVRMGTENGRSQLRRKLRAQITRR